MSTLPQNEPPVPAYDPPAPSSAAPSYEPPRLTPAGNLRNLLGANKSGSRSDYPNSTFPTKPRQ